MVRSTSLRRQNVRSILIALLLWLSLLGTLCFEYTEDNTNSAKAIGAVLPNSPRAAPIANPASFPISSTAKVSRIISQVLDYSTGGLPIEAYSFGHGPKRVVFIGGIHGGTEWNTILLAYSAIDYFVAHPESIPISITLQIIPSANPDGQKLVTGTGRRFKPADVRSKTKAGRFNHNGVDLNRNWDCFWRARAVWGYEKVSGGKKPFSEKESQILRNFLTKDSSVKGVIFWHSSAPGVFAGGCHGVYRAAEQLGEIYGKASGYPYGRPFSSYKVTGDAVDWLATQNIPAIDVELTNHIGLDWPQNFKGMIEVLKYIAQSA